MKPSSIYGHDRPLICGMIQCATADECIAKIKKSIDAGADALGIQMEKIRLEDRKPETLKKIFASCGDRPIYVTSYRHSSNAGRTDDELAETLLEAIDCGATLADVIGDMFDERPKKFELATSPEAVEKQKKLIDEIHRRGGEVLISCHTGCDPTLEENLMIANAQIERGADMIKIVNVAPKTSLPKLIESIQKISASTDRRLLFLSSGEADLIRYIGANFGVSMYLCVESHGQFDTPQQPLISRIMAIRDNILFK